jgi:hypothetical protein
MESQDTLLRLFDGALVQGEGYLASLPIALMIAFLVLPLVLAAVSKRPLALLGALTLIVLATTAFIRPEFAAPALAISSYIGSLLIAFLALLAGRKARLIRAELDALRSDIDVLRQIEERRLLLELRSNNHSREEPPAVRPAAEPVSPLEVSRDSALMGSGS